MVGDNFTVADTRAAVQVCREAAASFCELANAITEGTRIYAEALNAMQASMPQPTPLQQKMLRQKWDASRRKG